MESTDQIKTTAKEMLKSFIKDKDWAWKDFMSKSYNSVIEIRKFTADTIKLSVTIVAIVIPLLINFDVPLNRKFLGLSALFFSIEIVYGMVIRFWVSKREAEMWPVVWDSIEKTIDESIDDLLNVIQNPTQDNFDNAKIKMGQRHSTPDKKELGKIRKILKSPFLDFDYWFISIFLIAFILFIFALIPAFSVYFGSSLIP